MQSSQSVAVEYSARRQVPYIVIMAVALAALIGLGLFGVLPLWLVVAGGVVLAAILAIGITGVLQSARTGTVLAFDGEGLAVSGSGRVPWSALREVVIGPVQPSWLFGTDSLKVVSFVPWPGILLPDPPNARGAAHTFGRQARLRRYGTNLVVNGTALSISVNELVALVEALGGLPVRQLPSRAWRSWLVFIGLAVVVGLVVAIVSGIWGD